nr:hypothetical protein [uncultured Moraxella sp.]
MTKIFNRSRIKIRLLFNGMTNISLGKNADFARRFGNIRRIYACF